MNVHSTERRVLVKDAYAQRGQLILFKDSVDRGGGDVSQGFEPLESNMATQETKKQREKERKKKEEKTKSKRGTKQRNRKKIE